MTIHYADDSVTVYAGDCLEVMATLPDNSVDSVVTDPPYDLTSGKRGGSGVASVNLETPYGRSRIGTGNGGFMGKDWDATGVAFDPATWQQCLRVLKPGGHILAFGGTRTYHRLACAIEDAGFEIRDSIAWLYGSGFPKSLDVSKAINKAAGAEREVVRTRITPGSTAGKGLSNELDERPWLTEARINGYHEHASSTPATDAARQWQGWGTALKPAFEPIVVGRKPLRGTVANTVLQHGTGALNIDGCRVGADLRTNPPGSTRPRVAMGGGWREDAEPTTAAGRWPTNVVIDEHTATVIDAQSGNTKSPPVGSVARTKGGNTIGTFAHAGREPSSNGHGDEGGASRFFPTFRYNAKAPTTQRPTANGVAHPTVKPLDLMRWLVRLVTPPGGLVLDPFAGSGTTAEAAIHEHMRCITIEREPDYLPLIVARLSKPMAVGFDFQEGA